MRYTKFVTFILVIFLLCISVSATAPTEGEQRYPIMNTIGKLLASMFPIIQFNDFGLGSKPESIEIGYGEKVTLEVGMISKYEETEGEFYVDEGQPFLLGRSLSFEAEFPDGNPGAWFVNFDPPLLNSVDGTVLKSKATISLTAPPDSSYPVQSTIIRIKLTDTWAMGNVWFPEGFENWYPGKKFFWFTSAVTMGFGTLSGQVLPEAYYIDVLVKVKPYHAVDIEPVTLEKLQPDQITSMPIIVKNLGNYNDTFSFKITSESGDVKLVDPVTISLKPGETGNTLLGIAAPELVYDTGTLYPIIIETYSIDQPNVTIAQQRLFLETKGVYISEIGAAYSVIVCFFIFLGAAFFLFRKKRELANIVIKPQKPWNIPIERKHLEELKQKDKEAYEKERLMMEDEYKSAMLWYDSYRQSIKQEKQIGKTKQLNSKINEFFKKPEKKKVKPEKKKEEKQPKKEKKPEKKVEKSKEKKEEKPKETPEIAKEQYKAVQKRSAESERRKQIALEKIKRAQEKQKGKIKK